MCSSYSDRSLDDSNEETLDAHDLFSNCRSVLADAKHALVLSNVINHRLPSTQPSFELSDNVRSLRLCSSLLRFTISAMQPFISSTPSLPPDRPLQ